MTISIATLALTAVLAALVYAKFWFSERRTLPLPPGPPRNILWGNLFDVPTVRAWETYQRWSEKYGDLIYMKLPGRAILVLGSFTAANDLLHSKSHIYSTRIDSVMIRLLSWDWAIAALPYGAELRAFRRFFHEHFNASVVPKYHAVHLQEVRLSLTKMLEDPKHARDHIRRLPGNVIIRVVYGARKASKVQEYVKLAVKAMESARRIATPGVFLAEFVRFLAYIPPWLPGGAARAYANKYKPLVANMRDIPFDDVKRAASEGVSVPCIAYNLIRQLQGDTEMTPEQDKLARSVTGIAFAGGADTTIAATEAFTVAMAMFPEVQKKAQEELDRVIGPNRLPDIHDIPSLTYIRAVVMEVVRWMPAVPLGIPHCVSEDDEYRGYRIPKDTVVIVNAKAMLRDPEDYPEPELFKPERYIGKDGLIDPSVRDPRTIAFGFGRRACPGADFALALVSVYIANFLHVFDIAPGVDDEGRPTVLNAEDDDEAVISPLTFPRHFKPRSRDAERLVREQMIDDDFLC